MPSVPHFDSKRNSCCTRGMNVSFHTSAVWAKRVS